MFKDPCFVEFYFFLAHFNLRTLPLTNQRSFWGHLLRHLYLKNIYSRILYINWTVYSTGHRWHDLYKLHLTIFAFYEIFYGVSSNFFLICQINFQTYWDYFFHFILFFSSNVILTNDPTGKLFWKKSVSNWVILQSRTLSTVPLFNQKLPIFPKKFIEFDKDQSVVKSWTVRGQWRSNEGRSWLNMV